MIKLKPEQQEGFDKALELLKAKGIEKMHIFDFGTYREYELAGEFINDELLYDDYDNLFTNEEFNNLREWLEFIDNEDFREMLRKEYYLPKTGQNRLFLTNEGDFIYEYFRL